MGDVNFAEEEIYDLDLMTGTLEKYKKSLEANGRLENDEQKLLRMVIEQNFNNWFKLYGEW
jgi:hypothetical protein